MTGVSGIRDVRNTNFSFCSVGNGACDGRPVLKGGYDLTIDRKVPRKGKDVLYYKGKVFCGRKSTASIITELRGAPPR